jgi:hypothetical protein
VICPHLKRKFTPISIFLPPLNFDPGSATVYMRDVTGEPHKLTKHRSEDAHPHAAAAWAKIGVTSAHK